ncbi:unnamed protein product [Prorocentrum cordatum]|uniref:Uncharacterized protein n=1 Tax=Prorocentrum cordatum TaxID=2364126 RepID=A0ABN9WVY7_9DINO|nr:unnamed protein product [Polarella glacialis]
MLYRDGAPKAAAGDCGSSRAPAAPAAARSFGPPFVLLPRGERARPVVLGTSAGLAQRSVIANASYDSRDALHRRFPQCTDVHPDWLMQVDATHAWGVVCSRTPLSSTARTYVPAGGFDRTNQQRHRQRQCIDRALKRQQANESARVHALALQGELGFDPGAESERHISMVMNEQVPPEDHPFPCRDGFLLPPSTVTSSCVPHTLYTYFFEESPCARR